MNAIVVGCGLSGAVVARELAEKGWRVTIWDRRNHIGGNMYDYVDEHGVLVHKYGPHTFHTRNRILFEYMCRFEKWIPYKLTCGAMIDGKYTPTPFNFTTIDLFYSKGDAEELKKRISRCFPGRKEASVVEVLNSSDEMVRSYARFLFDNDYAPYTAKQWSVPAERIDPSVLKRVPLRFSYDDGYFNDEYEVMPEHSYTSFFECLLNHCNIKVELNVDAARRFDGNLSFETIVVYTGAVDELLGYKYGRLPYRSLRFEWHHNNGESVQPAAVVAYPQAPGFTRITDYSWLPPQKGHGTSYAIEYPLSGSDDNSVLPYYPVLTEQSIAIYNKYLSATQNIPNLFLCGRLADFKYYNMDQALERALETAKYVANKAS